MFDKEAARQVLTQSAAFVLVAVIGMKFRECYCFLQFRGLGVWAS